MFKPGKISMLVGARKRGEMPTTRTIEAMIDDELEIAFHPIPADTVLYQRCQGGWMYSQLKTGGAIPVYPAPADVETAEMFAYMINQGLSWDERNELARNWQNANIGNWVEVLPEESVVKSH